MATMAHSTTDSDIEQAYRIALEKLLAERHPDGYWVGELSTSALSTATAVMALSLVQRATSRYGSFEELIASGMQWLANHQNEDGGWGDTVVSHSNISTTMLCRAAHRISGLGEEHAESLQRGDAFIEERYGSTPEEQAEAVRARYGKDRTFAVPILTTCALAGMVSWKEVPPLPFELACFPQSWFRFLKLQVVSYALPALIAIGQCVHYHRKSWNLFSRGIRSLAKKRSLKVLERIQPSNGGYLEATPLTSFVTLSLASIGLAEHRVVERAVSFLRESVRSDGSWPIDTDLSTWVTTLSINALAAAKDLGHLEKARLRQWLLQQQYKGVHPYTGAEPGGWAWTPLPGGVPDADDTPGAILALRHLTEEEESPLPPVEEAILDGCTWLSELQNRDGGWPTFCRGWGTLPFDRSGVDLTAHALRAFAAWQKYFERVNPKMSEGSLWNAAWAQRAIAYLEKEQRENGSWLPLWFGNQHEPEEENPVYGTARVLAAYRDLDMMKSEPAQRAAQYLIHVQNEDGGWGGASQCPSSIEETALAVEVLLDAGVAAEDAVNKGLTWLVHDLKTGGLDSPTPIGFYFAKLWYYEKLYPIIFSVAALGRARRMLSNRHCD